MVLTDVNRMGNAILFFAMIIEAVVAPGRGSEDVPAKVMEDTVKVLSEFMVVT